jgi:hypothetical protein
MSFNAVEHQASDYSRDQPCSRAATPCNSTIQCFEFADIAKASVSENVPQQPSEWRGVQLKLELSELQTSHSLLGFSALALICVPPMQHVRTTFVAD